MNPLFGSIATLSISVIYLVWKMYRENRHHREKVVRQRVAYMLWVMAHRVA